MVNSPTHFTLTVAPSPRPVATSQNHQLASKALEGPCSCWLVKHVQARAVNAVKTIKGESSRMRRDWVSRPFSEKLLGHERRIINELPTKYDHPRTHCGSHCPTSSSLQCQEDHRDCHHTHYRRKQSHCHIWNARLEVIFSDVFEVELSIKPSHPPRKSQK